MYLKRLELQGFKTFAERTELELTSGITAVVGPNGTGKSNIVDAILWALGEQNVRELRGAKSQDVIFSGSEKRKPIGMAEVTMTFDNSSGKLPAPFAEVTVTRRAYRSGEGEYYINKTPCRLRDIYEMFMDTGVGREAYSIISQGEIDAILSARSEDRRGFFEEAAGVKKYRHRRKEATRKLESTQQNLQRIYDIISELDGQVEPLREQAETARAYNELSARLREIEVGLLISDLRRKSSELQAIQAAKGDGGMDISRHDARISALESGKEALRSDLVELERRIDQSRSAHQELSADRQRLESLAVLMEERTKTAEEACKNLDVEIAALETRRDETLERVSRLEFDVTAAAGRQDSLATEIAELMRQTQELDRQIEIGSRLLEEQKAGYIELAREEAARRSHIENGKQRVRELNSVVAKFDSELADLHKQKKQAAERAESAAKERESLKTQLVKLDVSLEAARAAQSEAEKELAEETRLQAQLQKTLLEKGSRLRALREMAESFEGFNEGVRSIMAAAKSHELHGHFAVVADIISVPEGFGTAIEVALGSSVQDIVADSVEDAKRAIRFLKDNDAGRATFLPLNGIRPTVSTMIGDVEKAPGYLGMAADLLDYNRKYSAAVNLLLGKVVIVDTIESAIKLRRGTAGWSKIVTQDGEVILPTGAMTGGSLSKGSNLVARKQEMDTLTVEVGSVQSDFDSRERRLAGLREKASRAAAAARSLEQDATEKRVSVADSERAAEFLAKESGRLHREVEVVAAEKDSAVAQLSEEEEALDKLSADLQSAGKENTRLDEIMAEARDAVDALTAKRRKIRDELLKLNVESAGARERISNLSRAVEDARSAIDESAARIASKREQRDKAKADSATNARDRRVALDQMEEQHTVYEGAEAELSDLLRRKSELSEKITTVDHELRDLARARNDLSQLIHDADVKEARLEVQLGQTKVRLAEEYEISEEEAQNWPEDIEIRHGTATEVARLRKEIRDMGPVNIGAVQEYDRVSERWDFLCGQKADLEEARDSLNRAIREIDEGTRDMFLSTFDAVAEAFDETFRRLFGGGKAKVSLTDPNDLLETGVEIVVQPPGKNLQNLSLLSGGEKTLSAAALLFALMKVKPSPFCVMDEVDAALDESNVERFADLVKDFSRNTQFIVITHNRATIEAADNLYGVTMQEPGISKLISVRLAGVETQEYVVAQDPAAAAVESVPTA